MKHLSEILICLSQKQSAEGPWVNVGLSGLRCGLSASLIFDALLVTEEKKIMVF